MKIMLILVVLLMNTMAWATENHSSGESEKVFLAGAATADITPGEGVSIEGTISKRGGKVKEIRERLHVRAIVLDDGNIRLAVVICDACYIGRPVFDHARQIIQEAIKLPATHICMAATHTHAAVRAIHVGTSPADDAYHTLMAQRIAAAVIEAAENLAPARIGFGAFDKAKYVSNRRFLCKPGTVSPNPFGESDEQIKSVAARSSGVIKPFGQLDPQFSVLSIQHTDGKPLAVLGNYSLHCGAHLGAGIVSTDYFGHYADALEEALSHGEHPPFVGLMSNGTSANSKGGSNVSGKLLANDTQDMLKKLTYRSDITLDVQQSELKLGVRRPDKKRIAWAKAVLGNPNQKHPNKTKIYAEEALHLSKYPESVLVPIQAIRIGDIGIVAIPCEVFGQTGLAIKSESPLKRTFTIELANGYYGYLPTAQEHELGGYETWPARSSFLEVNAESKIRAEALRLLRKVAPEQPSK